MKMRHRRMGPAALVMIVVGGWLAIASGQQKSPTVQQATADALLGAAQYQEQIEGRLEAAIATYRKVLGAADATREQKARAQFRIGACYERLGLGEARKAYEAVVANYADQVALAAEAKARLAALAEPATSGGGPVVRQIWATTAGVEGGRISPDGRSLVGVDEDTGDLVIRSVSTGQIRRLTAIRKDRSWLDYAESPVWSRDGRQIAYKWEMWTSNTSRGPAEFRIAEVTGGISRVVPLDARFRMDDPYGWSPDGRRVLARLDEGPLEKRRRHLGWVSTSSGSVELLASAPTGKDFGPAFLSPDGAWIVSRIPSDDTAFSIIAARGGTPQPLIPAAPSDELIGWSPDGTLVLLVSREAGSRDLMAVRVTDGRAADRPFLIRTLEDFSSLGVSQAGALVYQSAREPRTHVYRASFDAISGRVGPASRVDVSEGYSNGSVSWSPDGRRLAYVSWPYGAPANTLSVWSADNAQIRSFVLPFKAHKWGQRGTSWSPDGRWVFVGAETGTAASPFYRVDAQTGAVDAGVPPSVRVFASKDPDTLSRLAGWSPDGGVVYKADRVNRPEGPHGAIVAHRLADHTERELFRSSGVPSDIRSFAVSWDGSQLAFGVRDWQADTNVVMVMPAAGGPAKTVSELTRNGGQNLRWTPDGRLIAGRSLWDVTTGAVTKLNLSAESVSVIVVSPDGKEIAFAGGPRWEGASVWLLENFLPKPTAPAPKK